MAFSPPDNFVNARHDAYGLQGYMTVLGFLGVSVFLWIRAGKRQYNLPPGPKNYPVLGCLPLVDQKRPFDTFSAWARKYGKFFYCEIGKDRVVVLNDALLVKKIFSSDLYQNRPQNPGVVKRKAESGGHCGVIFGDGQSWKDHRRFVMRTLKDFGVGKRSIEEKIAEECIYLVQMFRDTAGAPFDNKVPISTAVANVISNVVGNVRYDAKDPEFVGILNAIATLFRSSFASTMINSYKWARYIPPFRGVFQNFQRCADNISKYFGKLTTMHFETWQANSDRDMMDAYISSLKKAEFNTFAEKQLSYLVEDLMEAGYETTTTSLRWVPAGSVPRPSDRLKLPYTEAVLAEVHRFCSFVPFGVMHAAKEDTVLQTYDIPKGTWILPNIYFIHHDERHWEDPFVFKPERFLSAECPSSENFLPFSIGKRRCPGESLAQVEMIMFFSAVLKNFRLHLSAELKDMTPLPGATLETPPHCIVAVAR